MQTGGQMAVSDTAFGAEFNEGLVHQVVTAYLAAGRAGTKAQKTRSDVSGGGRKPWKQKGTGRARHGSSRSPIWVGGGITHGPRKTKNFSRKINRSMRTKALFVALSQKARRGELAFIEGLAMKEPKAKQAKEVLTNLARAKGFEAFGRRNNAALIALSARNEAVVKSFRNFGNVEVVETAALNPVAVLGKRMVLIASPEESLSVLSARAK